MHNGGVRPKANLSEAGDTTNSMMRWLILMRMNDHFGANMGRYFAINVPYGAILMFSSVKRLIYYHWMEDFQL